MADPATIMMVASTAFSVVGSIQQGKAAQAAANRNAAVADRNAILARQNAQVNAEREDRRNRMLLGMNSANRAARGITTEGSYLDLMEDNMIEAELDRMTILQQGELEAQGYSISADSERAAGANAKTAGYMKAGSALLVGGSKAYKSGAFTSSDSTSTTSTGSIPGSIYQGRNGGYSNYV